MNTAPFKIAELMRDYPHPWCICGGWSVDLFLNRETRTHKDVDIAILRRDQLHLRSYLATEGWTLEKAQDGQLVPWEAEEFIELPTHVIWCKHPDFQPDFLEVLFNEADDTHFRFRRDLSITRELSRAFLTSQSGLPILAPEIVLLYKSKAVSEEGNAADFRTCLPYLNATRRIWLKAALSKIAPDHEWLKHL